MKPKYLKLVSVALFSMMSITPLLLVAMNEAAAPVFNPLVYQHVARVVWVVRDVDSVVDYWQRLGIHNIHRDGVVKFPHLRYRGKSDSAVVKQVTAHVGAMEIQWIQPIRGGKFWMEWLQRQGDGIRAVAYNTVSLRISTSKLNILPQRVLA